jgi:hypothetical protein
VAWGAALLRGPRCSTRGHPPGCARLAAAAVAVRVGWHASRLLHGLRGVVRACVPCVPCTSSRFPHEWDGMDEGSTHCIVAHAQAVAAVVVGCRSRCRDSRAGSR